MKTVCLDGKIINVDKIHFVRYKNATTLLISYGSDYIEISRPSNEISKTYKMLSDLMNAQYVL